jgi:hypothetical protein
VILVGSLRQPSDTPSIDICNIVSKYDTQLPFQRNSPVFPEKTVIFYMNGQNMDVPELQIIFKSKGNYPLLLKMMGICIFPLHCCTLLQKRLLTCTLKIMFDTSDIQDCLHVHLKLCLTQVIFNKHRMQVKCISLFNLTRLCHVY